MEGETLSERIARGPLPVPEALGIAAQIASALEAAHERGIVHRDLKPGNVKLRPDGTVKLLDFGLAKVPDTAATTSDPGTATLTAAELPGGGAHVLGSPAYMSPEQARGLVVDKRGDIWSFGCLLYEMLSGVRAFDGERILRRARESHRARAGFRRPCPRICRTPYGACCDAAWRRTRGGDCVTSAMRATSCSTRSTILGGEPTASGAIAMRAAYRKPRSLRRMVLAVGLVVVLTGAAAWFALRSKEPAPQVTRFAINEPNFVGGGLAISADGTRIAYTDDRGLVVRSRDRLESKLIAARNVVQGMPFFSPDGEWVGFRGWEALRTVPSNGGPVNTVEDRRTSAAGDWVGDEIVFADTTGMFRTSAQGGEPVALATAAEGEQIVSVEILAGRGAILFTVIPTRGYILGMATSLPSARIEALDLATGKRHIVVRGGGQPRYTRTGHLLYVSGGTLYAAAFDIDKLQTRGPAVPVIVSEGLLDYDVSAEGTLVYQSARSDDQRELAWVDRQGPRRIARHTYQGLPVSPHLARWQARGHRRHGPGGSGHLDVGHRPPHARTLHAGQGRQSTGRLEP